MGSMSTLDMLGFYFFIPLTGFLTGLLLSYLVPAYHSLVRLGLLIVMGVVGAFGLYYVFHAEPGNIDAYIKIEYFRLLGIVVLGVYAGFRLQTALFSKAR